MNIGLTGGIATGKSSVSAWLSSKGAKLIDADLIAREVMMPNHPVLSQVVERFGADMLQADGTLNRKKLGEHIFTHPEERKSLEDITHPAIRELIQTRTVELEQQYPDTLVVADIPLLLEAKGVYTFDQIMVVYVPQPVQLQRLISRDGLTEEQAWKRINAQMDIEQKKKVADIVIDNSGTLEDTYAQLEQFWQSKGLS
ncbi:dephospho-CoA kinase [Paenibacillus sp. SORGH_AS306]|uniref:Dephospho-CoA kinase n=1 Tax=Paenibacillus kyungheensis TaxID=1452732 RepID=A0AAX3M504_9BACL|nr:MULTISPECIES: dephospho-CoA kinase [Paenibacillus]MDQ1233384.1 dephospho-CoA kinase [Paenibacillus sp. SORGH_AS_0306]MDR6110424.1 dephospho-CoA kinase [Paenibacillus sp. SORGH_AS_0338]WCT57317.1 dephospho-CoA kinase [Paenibacillus kyungheensis]